MFQQVIDHCNGYHTAESSSQKSVYVARYREGMSLIGDLVRLPTFQEN